VSGFLLRCIFNGIILVFAVCSMPGIFVDSLGATLIGATTLGLANAFIRPALTSFSIPLDSTVLGWTTVITNITLPTMASRVLPGVEVHGLITKFLFITGLSISSYVLTRCIQDR
jgi:putative membrane protein